MGYETCETPLYDLLHNVPADARAVYENNPTDFSFIPYGSFCQRAAVEIRRLEAKNERMREMLVKIAGDGTEIMKQEVLQALGEAES